LGGSDINAAKVVLANEVTRLVRGAEAARAAEATAAATFAGGGTGQDLPVLECADASIAIVDALIGLGFAASRGEAKRLVAGGGARVEGAQVTDDTHVIHLQDTDIRVSSGKKKHGVLRQA
jgi:tyrosyl-tRNA synthetase